jgi:hypothetical protein
MDIRIKAALQTAAIIAMAIISAVTIQFVLNTFSSQDIINVLGIIFGAWVVSIMYSIVLNRLKYEEQVKKMQE